MPDARSGDRPAATPPTPEGPRSPAGRPRRRPPGQFQPMIDPSPPPSRPLDDPDLIRKPRRPGIKRPSGGTPRGPAPPLLASPPCGGAPLSAAPRPSPRRRGDGHVAGVVRAVSGDHSGIEASPGSNHSPAPQPGTTVRCPTPPIPPTGSPARPRPTCSSTRTTPSTASLEPERAGARHGRGPADLPLDRLLGVPLVPRHGARELREPADRVRDERALRQHQGRPRGAARPG